MSEIYFNILQQKTKQQNQKEFKKLEGTGEEETKVVRHW